MRAIGFGCLAAIMVGLVAPLLVNAVDLGLTPWAFEYGVGLGILVALLTMELHLTFRRDLSKEEKRGWRRAPFGLFAIVETFAYLFRQGRRPKRRRVGHS